MEPEQRKLPRLLCFYTDTTNNSTTKPAPPSTGNQESSSHLQRQHHTTKPNHHPAHQQNVSPNSSRSMKQQTAANHTNHMSRHTKTRGPAWQKHNRRKPVRSISHGVIRVPPARILWGALIPTTVAALLSRGLAIYVYLRHTGMLPLCLLMCVPGAIRVPPARGLWGYVEPTTVATLLCRGKSRISANIKC